MATPAPPPPPRVTLASINTALGGAMTTVEGNLEKTLNDLGDGANISVTDMVGLQYDMSVYTITGQTISAIMKESADTMKSVVQKV